jgi:hypothetical protein
MKGSEKARRTGIPVGNEPAVLKVDHLVYATPDLETTVAELERQLGVRATPGGQHIGRGTHNALIALGPSSYIEIVGPDPAQSGYATPRWFGIDGLAVARLVGWAAKGVELERLVERAARRGVQLGPVDSGSRQRPDGVALRWQFTDPTTVVGDGVVPFFIDWGASPHPSATAASGPLLVGLRAEHPDPEGVRRILRALDVDLLVQRGERPALFAKVRTAAGQVELR